MKRDYRKWHSPALERDMELLVFGEGGTPVLVFPTSMGRFYQWEDFGMVAHMAERIDAGWLQLWCVDSVDAESFYDKKKAPQERAQRHLAYERYLVDEVLPNIRAENPVDFLIAVGAIIAFGVHIHLGWLDLSVVGWVLMLAGFVGLVLTLWFWNSRRRRVVVQPTERQVVDPQRSNSPRSDMASPSRMSASETRHSSNSKKRMMATSIAVPATMTSARASSRPGLWIRSARFSMARVRNTSSAA